MNLKELGDLAYREYLRLTEPPEPDPLQPQQYQFLTTISAIIAPLAIPQQLVAGAITGGWPGLRERLSKLPEFLRAPFTGTPPADYITGEQILARFGISVENLPPWQRFLATLGAEMFTDPTILVSWARGLGLKAAEALTPAGLFRAVSSVAPGPINAVRSISETVLHSITVPLPHARGTQIQPIAGLKPESLRPTLAEALFPHGRVPWGRSVLEGGRNLPEELTGSPQVGPGLLREARGYGEQLRHYVMAHIAEIDDTLRTVDPKRGPIYRILDDLVGNFLREVVLPPELREEVLKAVPSGAVAWVNLADRAVQGSTTRQKYLQKIEALAKEVGRPAEELIQAFDRAAVAGWKAAVATGFELSRYPEFYYYLEETARRAGITPQEALAAFANNAGTEKLREIWKEVTEDALWSLDPTDYLNALMQGPLRIATGRFLDVSEIVDAVRNKSVVIVNSGDVARIREKFGDDLASLVEILADASPARVVRIRDVAELARQMGITDDISELLREFSPSYQLLEESLDRINRSRPTTYHIYALRRKPLAQHIAAIDTVVGATAALAQLGLRGGAAVRAQTFLEGIYRLLQETNAILEPREALKFVAEGVDYVVMPNSANVWGPLAGKAIPKWAAREILKIAMLPPGMRSGPLTRLTNIVRQAFLSPLPTALRNAVGNLILLDAAGIPIAEVIRYMPRAHRALLQHIREGASPELAGAEHVLNFLGDATLARQVQETIDDKLFAVISNWAAKPKGILDYAERLVEKLARMPPIGFLGWFQYFEDLTRASVFLWAKDNLLKAGVDPSEAIFRAAHISNTAAFDYTSTGAAIDALRRSGLALFPAFTYFAVGRVASAAVSNPGALTKYEHIVNAINQATMPDPEERDRISQMIAHSLFADLRPIVLPAGQEGHYYLVPVDFFLLQRAVSPAQVVSLASEPVFGGVLRPLVDLVYAFHPDNPEPGTPTPQTAAYYGRIFHPGATAPERIAGAAAFLALQFTPGAFRDIRRIYNAVALDEDTKELLELLSTRYFNSDPQQVIMRQLGLPSYEIDLTGEVTLRQVLRRLERQTADRVTVLNRRIRDAIARDDNAALEQAIQELVQVRMERARKTLEAIGGLQ